MDHKVSRVIPGSIAEELEIQVGDVLLQMNGAEIEDVLDYNFYMQNEELTLLFRTPEGDEYEAELEKEEYEDLGLVFEDSFMSSYRHCHNKCIFCFIDQLPKGMRPSLYFKDDDSRLSFLNGNYITFTNMSDHDFDRIIRYHMSPMNVSIHTTDPELRVRMLKNPKAGRVMEYLDRFKEAGIVMNGQIVLCKGFNDGAALDRSLSDLFPYCPQMQSLSIVPVGLTRFREGLEPLESFTKEDCIQIIEQVRAWRQKYYEAYGVHFVHLSDEFFITAEMDLPVDEEYDGYPQIENGVGMMRLFVNESQAALDQIPDGRNPFVAEEDPTVLSDEDPAALTLVTGVSASRYIKELVRQFCEKTGEKIRVVTIINHFFGEKITVSGLLTGTDIIDQLKGKNLGKGLLLPENLLRAGEEVLLDDVSVTDIKNALQVPVFIVKSSGTDFIRHLREICCIEGKPVSQAMED